MISESEFKVLRVLATHEYISQRTLALAAGVSLGSVNAALKGLVGKNMLEGKNGRGGDTSGL